MFSTAEGDNSMAGLYFEEFEPGMEFKHELTRTVTEMETSCSAR